MSYEIRKSLVLSTGHITKKDSELLADKSLDFCRDDVRYGWNIWVGDSDGACSEVIPQAKELGFSDAFCNLLRLAHSQQCAYLVLDRDGLVHEELPKFDW